MKRALPVKQRGKLRAELVYSPARALLRAVKQHPHRESLIDGMTGESWSLAQASNAVVNTAIYLRERGCLGGSRIAIIAPNSVWHFVIHVAASILHAVTVPISPQLPAIQRRQMLELAEVDLVLSVWADDDREFFESSAEIHEAPAPDDSSNSAPALAGKHVDWAEFLTEANTWWDQPTPAVEAPACSDEAAALLFTSGSSGTPKPVVLTHAQLWWASLSFRDGFEYTPTTSRVGVCVPLSHIGGFNGTSLDTFSHGGTLIVFSNFDPAVVAQGIEHYGITQMFAVPAMVPALLEAAESVGADLSSWSRPLIGGEKLSPALFDRMRSTGLNPLHVWGMTECGGAGTVCSPEQFAAHPGSIGRPFPYVDLDLVDDRGTIITAPEILGEIRISGPGVVGGQVHTGDIAQLDADGFVHFVSRESRMINTGGELVAPALVEEALLAHTHVTACCVVGVPNERWGQIIAAAIVMAPENTTDSVPTARPRLGSHATDFRAVHAMDASGNHASGYGETLDKNFAINQSDASDNDLITDLDRDFLSTVIAQVNETLAPWQRIRRALVVETLPLTSTGKINSQAVTDLFL